MVFSSAASSGGAGPLSLAQSVSVNQEEACLSILTSSSVGIHFSYPVAARSCSVATKAVDVPLLTQARFPGWEGSHDRNWADTQPPRFRSFLAPPPEATWFSWLKFRRTYVTSLTKDGSPEGVLHVEVGNGLDSSGSHQFCCSRRVGGWRCCQRRVTGEEAVGKSRYSAEHCLVCRPSS